MIALCHEKGLEHRTKHIALRYFLARELQQRGQLRLSYVATTANSADIFTKALQSGDHQRFCTVLGLLALLFLTGLMSTSRALELVTKLNTPSDVEAGEAAVLSVKPPACLISTFTSANDIRAAITTPRRPTLKQPLTKLLGRQGLTPMLMPLPLATSGTSTPSSSPTATSPTAATTATPTVASTAATRAPTPATSPTTATTSTASTTCIAAPTTNPAAPSTTPATFALAVAALRTSRSSSDVLCTRDICSSSRGVGGGKGGGGAPLKEGHARSATSSTYSNCTSLSCEKVLLN
ncbi:unnamed protein product [Closterium sp. NIES-53]